MFVRPNIYKVECTDGSYVFASQNQEGVTLIDSHFPGKAEEIDAELTKAGLTPVSRILFTHVDMDHTGNAAFFQRKYGCKVYLSAREFESTTDPVKTKRGKGDPFEKVEKPELTVLEGNEIAGIKVIPAYGHTYGHVCYLFEGVLFAGDLICTENGVIKEMALQYIRDREQSWEAIEKVDEQATFDLLCPSHGEPLACSKITVSEWREGR